MTASAQRYARASNAPFRRVGDRIIVAPPRGEGFEVLEGTAVEIWGLLDRPRSVPEIVDILSRRYIATREQLERDVTGLLFHLEHRGTVEVVHGG